MSTPLPPCLSNSVDGFQCVIHCLGPNFGGPDRDLRDERGTVPSTENDTIRHEIQFTGTLVPIYNPRPNDLTDITQVSNTLGSHPRVESLDVSCLCVRKIVLKPKTDVLRP